MKKNYICPKIECMNFGPVVLYTGSVNGDVNGPVGARRYLLLDDEDCLIYDDDL